MRVVVTGASGNVGTSVLEALEADPAITSVVGVCRRVPDGWRPAKVEWVGVDVAEDPLEPVVRGADAVVHLAWLFQPTHDQLATWRNNVLGSIRVFEAVAAAGVPALVHASSVGAYSPGPDQVPVDEAWPTHALPHAAYGREKSYLERYLDAFEHTHPLVRVVRLRPGFIFKETSAAQQRRLFAGPLVPGSLARPGLIPIVPDLPGLRFQALHSLDAGEAFHQAVVREVRGAFNVAADPVVDAQALGQLLGARPVKVPLGLARTAVAAAWRAHLVPASPMLLDLFLSIPVMDVGRARRELGWEPRHTSLEALGAFLEGLRGGVGGPTPPLASHAGGRLRGREVLSGVGSKADPADSR
jgi:nucleoside-diphosphate-sugar epimerase